MGISWGRTARVIVSAKRSRTAPDNMDRGISFRLSGPVINLTIWGTRSPTKPIMPDIDTQTAARKEPERSRIKVTFFKSTPRLDADFAPREIRLRSLAKNMEIKNPAIRKIMMVATLSHVLEAKLPISQKMMTDTCSLAMNFKKLIPAERMAATITPDKIRLLEERPAIGFLDE